MGKRSIPRPIIWRVRWIGAALLSLCLLATTLTAHAQSYAKTESFRNKMAPGFLLGGGADRQTPDRGRATLTATTTDAAGEGYLQLTNTANLFQVGYVLDNTSFSTKNGFSIAFDYGSYGSTVAPNGDGLCAFFVDGAASGKSFVVGGTGGSLGYAPQASYPAAPGMTNAYLGIGFDEFGNFSDPTGGHVGGPGRVPNAVALRGAGSEQGVALSPIKAYPFLTGTAPLGFSVAGAGATRAQPVSTDERYRRAYLDVKPTADGYALTLRIQHGSSTSTVLADYPLAAVPPTLRFGIAASTGGNNSIYEVRNLSIRAEVVPPPPPVFFALYPNPTVGASTLDMTQLPAGSYHVRVFDIVGRQLLLGELTGGAKHPLDVAALPVGVYVVLVQGQSFKATLMLVRD